VTVRDDARTGRPPLKEERSVNDCPVGRRNAESRPVSALGLLPEPRNENGRDMCGIVGIVGDGNVVPEIVEGLRRLEYRGYDSAGVAVVGAGRSLARVRAAGKIVRLEEELVATPLEGSCGVGHTRWATHGRPTDDNAHPHASCAEDLALVHNGIIENYLELRASLQEKGHELQSETDTEVLVHLIEQHLAACGKGGSAKTLAAAVAAAAGEVIGVHAMAVVSSHEPDRIVVTSNGPPALIGIGEHCNIVASDLTAILTHADRVIFLEEGDVAEVTRDDVSVKNLNGEPVERAPRKVDLSPMQAEKGGYRHFMLKEIHEQPLVLEEALVGRLCPDTGEVLLEEIGLSDEDFAGVERVLLLGCGTSHNAGLIGRDLIESMARIPCDVEISSEFRYRDPIVAKGTLAIALTQSGETADTIAAMREAKARGAKVVAACNVLGSLATREADGTLHLRAGMEIGVASTKCFTAQVVALTLLALRLSRSRGTLSPERRQELVEGLRRLPRQVEQLLAAEDKVDAIAKLTVQADDYLFLGRGIMFPTALEGALKLKEISYIHAEGYTAGEMKHGPIALIDENMPVVGLCPKTSTYEKILSNVQEVKARDGILIALVTEGDDRIASFADHVLEVPEVEELLAPVIFSVPLQLLAYHVAVRRGCDVDQPRNLAKSVTVE
jgi:glucosamine--fructose-6-phosphate aminotransferase (isomerizing)